MLRTVGLLGALEPHKYSVIVAHLQNYDKKATADRKGSDSENGIDFKGDIPLAIPFHYSNII